MSGDKEDTRIRDRVFIAQIISVSSIWVFVIVLTVWIVHLLLLSMELGDAPGFSIAISLVAVPVLWILVGILTYVFVGLRRDRMPH